MKKLLSLLAATGLVATSSVGVIACDSYKPPVQILKHGDIELVQKDAKVSVNTGSGPIVQDAVIAKIQEVFGTDVQEGVDFTFSDFVGSGGSGPSRIRVDAIEGSEKLSGGVTFSAVADIETKTTLERLYFNAVNLGTNENNSEEQVRIAVAAKVKKYLNVDTTKDDYKCEIDQAATQTIKGKAKVRVMYNNTKISGLNWNFWWDALGEKRKDLMNLEDVEFGETIKGNEVPDLTNEKGSENDKNEQVKLYNSIKDNINEKVKELSKDATESTFNGENKNDYIVQIDLHHDANIWSVKIVASESSKLLKGTATILFSKGTNGVMVSI
ncbi:lipoprotein [Spiroplasma helicoides]|nr:lipoprotein [Spiroplasma helicoides]